LSVTIQKRLNNTKEKLRPMIEKLPGLFDKLFEGEKLISLKLKNLNISE
jgi:hypothetical protein